MLNKKKLLLVESEMLKAKGHFLDYLIETSSYFKKTRNIFWFLNKDFDSESLYLPEYCNIKKVIKTNKFKRQKNKFYFLFLKKFFGYYLFCISF